MGARLDVRGTPSDFLGTDGVSGELRRTSSALMGCLANSVGLPPGWAGCWWPTVVAMDDRDVLPGKLSAEDARFTVMCALGSVASLTEALFALPDYGSDDLERLESLAPRHPVERYSTFVTSNVSAHRRSAA